MCSTLQYSKKKSKASCGPAEPHITWAAVGHVFADLAHLYLRLD